MLKEFKAFVLRGNLVEIAVAFIMGLAFAGVVTAFTNIVLGAIAYVLGSSTSFDDVGIHKGTALIVPIGAFVAACINFLIVAAVLFFVVKAYNRMQKPADEPGPTEVELLTEIRDALRAR
jgi:large conductance mechanosensitive channel